jgi:hypothetical protein
MIFDIAVLCTISSLLLLLKPPVLKASASINLKDSTVSGIVTGQQPLATWAERHGSHTSTHNKCEGQSFWEWFELLRTRKCWQ